MAENRNEPEGQKPQDQQPQPEPQYQGYTASAPPPAPPPRELPPLPRGFWGRVDFLLRNSEDVREMLRRDVNIWALARLFLTVSILMAVLYGAVMGATNLLQGSEMLLKEKLAMIVITAIKVPALFLLTFLIVVPPIYVSNAFVGARLEFRQMFALLLAAVAISSTILASMASVAFFFALTSKSYHFIKLLHVLFFAYAGITGLVYLTKCIHEMAVEVPFSQRRRTPVLVFIVWILLYMFVGTQLAWVLRPFVGSPNEPFQVFRERRGNFYESVGYSIGRVIVEDEEQ